MTAETINRPGCNESYLKSLSIEYVPGVGRKTAQKLSKLGLNNLYDALLYLPNRYQDRTRITEIAAAKQGQFVVIQGRIINHKYSFGNKRSLLCDLADDSGQIRLRFFHFSQSQLNLLIQATVVRCFGEIRTIGNQLEIIHPEYEYGDSLPALTPSLTPIYPLISGVTQKLIRKITAFACNLLQQYPISDYIQPLLADEKSLSHLPSVKQAFDLLHNPERFENNHARIRLAIEELITHHLSALVNKYNQKQIPSLKLPADQHLTQSFVNQLPFELTTAQIKVQQEIDCDLNKPVPMARLLQGDVGSGKTVIAALAILNAVANQTQAAFMAPTEILAEQHFFSLQKWFVPLNISVAILTSSLSNSEKKEILSNLIDGKISVIIGTHALIQDNVKFKKLALCIIDEQHKFGVAQRHQLIEKNSQLQPHQLIMTATPIPRTMAMTLYAGLDVSVIDALPPGRQSIQTFVFSETKRNEIVERINEQCQLGNQAYWVCPLIEDSEHIECQAAESTKKNLTALLPNCKVGLIHGKLSQNEKDNIMRQFKTGDLSLLVATTVIEVGVDVPNATFIVIENAERLGLAQLHQLRGRVGRGNKKSYCLLLYKEPLSMVAKKRLQLMRESNDGFYLAEKDLEIRGPGEWLGTTQTGCQSFKVANLETDQELMVKAQEIANTIFNHHANLINPLIDRWLKNKIQFATI